MMMADEAITGSFFAIMVTATMVAQVVGALERFGFSRTPFAVVLFFGTSACGYLNCLLLRHASLWLSSTSCGVKNRCVKKDGATNPKTLSSTDLLSRSRARAVLPAPSHVWGLVGMNCALTGNACLKLIDISAKSINFCAKSIDVCARSVQEYAKSIEVGSKYIEVNAKSIHSTLCQRNTHALTTKCGGYVCHPSTPSLAFLV